MRTTQITPGTLFAVLLLLVSSSAVADEKASDKEGWIFSLTPYLWLPTISGDLNFEPPPGGGGGEPGVGVEVGPTDWLELLNGAALLSGTARNGRFSINGDAVYLSLKSENDRILSVGGGDRLPAELTLDLDTETEFDGAIFTVAVGYAVSESERAPMEIIAGVRYVALDVTAKWSGSAALGGANGSVELPAVGSRGRDVDLTDAIIGVRGEYKFGDGRWSAPYYLDVGAGSSDFTWQGLLGVARLFSWGDVRLMYRHLDYDEGSDEFLRNLTLSGPALGAQFRF